MFGGILVYVAELGWLLVAALIAMLRTQHIVWRAWVLMLGLSGLSSGWALFNSITASRELMKWGALLVHLMECSR